MTLEEAEGLAEALLLAHGLHDWTFAFDRARRRLGCCDYARKRVTLSRHFVRLNPLPVVRDVVLHEIAHALTPGAGHGPRFKRKALELGCTAASCLPSDAVVSPSARYRLECAHCGRTFARHRRPSRPLVCARCARSGRSPLRPLRLYDEGGGQP